MEAEEILEKRLASARNTRIQKLIKQQRLLDTAPRAAQYQGFQINSGAIIRSVGDGVRAIASVSNGLVAPGDSVQLVRGAVDWKPRVLLPVEEEIKKEEYYPFKILFSVEQFIDNKNVISFYVGGDRKVPKRLCQIPAGAVDIQAQICNYGSYFKASVFCIIIENGFVSEHLISISGGDKIVISPNDIFNYEGNESVFGNYKSKYLGDGKWQSPIRYARTSLRTDISGSSGNTTTIITASSTLYSETKNTGGGIRRVTNAITDVENYSFSCEGKSLSVNGAEFTTSLGTYTHSYYDDTIRSPKLKTNQGFADYYSYSNLNCSVENRQAWNYSYDEYANIQEDTEKEDGTFSLKASDAIIYGKSGFIRQKIDAQHSFKIVYNTRSLDVIKADYLIELCSYNLSTIKQLQLKPILKINSKYKLDLEIDVEQLSVKVTATGFIYRSWSGTNRPGQLLEQFIGEHVLISCKKQDEEYYTVNGLIDNVIYTESDDSMNEVPGHYFLIGEVEFVVKALGRRQEKFNSFGTEFGHMISSNGSFYNYLFLKDSSYTFVFMPNYGYIPAFKSTFVTPNSFNNDRNYSYITSYPQRTVYDYNSGFDKDFYVNDFSYTLNLSNCNFLNEKFYISQVNLDVKTKNTKGYAEVWVISPSGEIYRSDKIYEGKVLALNHPSATIHDTSYYPG